MSWPTKPLADVADFCLGKMLDAQKNRGEPLPYLANKNVRWGEFDLADLREMRFEHDEMDRYGLRHGDIVMCEGGEPGRCAIWKDEVPGMMFQKALHRIRPHNELDYRFLFYWFFLKGRNGGFAPLFTGATIKHLPREKLELLEVAVPPRDVQTRIADMLSAYDDLIENNRRRMALLEEAARQLYREWFVRLRFPGHEHTPITDGVPEGWERRKISDICETVGGGTPSTSVDHYWDGDITWVIPSDVTKNDGLVLLNTERKITEPGLRDSSAKLLPPWAILMTSRASVGFFALMDKGACTNQGFINIIPKGPHRRMYLLFNLMHRVEEIRANAKGSTYPEISKGRFRQLQIVVPTHEPLLREFDALVWRFVQEIRCLKEQNERLCAARDLLLPRLMSGEVAV